MAMVGSLAGLAIAVSAGPDLAYAETYYGPCSS